MIGRRIASHEWTLLRREAAWWFAMGLLLLSVAYAWSNGQSVRDRRAREVARDLVSAQEHLASERQAAESGEPAGFGGRAGSARTVATAPPGRLADFSIGQSELYPHRADISPFRRADDLFGNYQLQSPLTLLSGRFDLGFVAVYLLPLLIIALSYNLLSSEREQGTLPLAMTQPITLRQLLDAKLVARTALILGPFAGLSIVLFAVSADFSDGRVALFALWLSTALAYGLFWIALVGLVNTLGRRSETNAVILACIWLGIVVVVPGLLSVAIDSLAPTPSRLAYVSEMRGATADASRRSSEVLANYYEDHPELAEAEMQSGFLPAFFAQQRDVEENVVPVIAEFESRLTSQQRLVRFSSFLSPAVLVQEAFNDIAGSGLSRQQSFVAQARAFLAEWHGLLRPKIFADPEMTAADYDGLPTFELREDSVATVFARTAYSWVALLLPTTILFIWARSRTGRPTFF